MLWWSVCGHDGIHTFAGPGVEFWCVSRPLHHCYGHWLQAVMVSERQKRILEAWPYSELPPVRLLGVPCVERSLGYLSSKWLTIFGWLLAHIEHVFCSLHPASWLSPRRLLATRGMDIERNNSS